MSTDPHTAAARTIAAEVDDPLLASVVTAAETTITPVPLAALPDWRLLDVLWRGPSHPARWLLAVAHDRAVVLTSHPERWEVLLEEATVGSADDAVELACVRADATRDMAKGYRRLSHIDDIRWRPHPSDDQRQRIEQVRAAFADRVAPASVVGDGPWTVTLWTLTDGSLVRHEVDVARDGSATETTVVAAEDLPVPVVR